MTISELKQLFAEELSERYSREEISMLYLIFGERILNKTAAVLRNSGGETLDINTNSQFRNTLMRLKMGKPYQQILGDTEFFGLKFFVNEHVLIPRPETEELLQLAINKIKTFISPTGGQQILTEKPKKILDIGTGSGIIPIVLKKHFPEFEITAVDLSPKALEIAGKNAAFHHTDIDFVQADYLQLEINGNFDVIISNPPYIGNDEKPDIPDSVKDYEPEMALFSPTSDPLLFYRKIALDAEKHLSASGLIFLEINQKHGAQTLELFKNFNQKELLKDISGNDRMLFISK